jgi:hypothetical protein
MIVRSGLFACILALLASAAPAEETEEVVAVKETIAFAELHPSSRSVISRAAQLAWGDIADARAHAAAKDGPKAQREAVQARKLLALIRHATPTTALEKSITSARKSLMDGGAADLVPVYSTLEVYADVAEAEAVRVTIDEAKAKAEAGEDSVAVELLESATVQVRYVEIDLPVKTSLARVQRAVIELRNRDFMAAEHTLAVAQEDLRVVGGMMEVDFEADVTEFAEEVVE